jgi:L-lactate utilization protein LutB
MDFLNDHQQYIERLKVSLSRISDLDLARKRLTYIRWKVAENLDKFLFEFETNVRKTDKGIFWCPDAKTSLEVLNLQTKNYSRVKFYKHEAVKHLVNEIDIKLPETSENPEVAVIGAKFIMANTGNFYTALQDLSEYKEILKAKKIVVIAGIDSVLASQAELPLAKQLYATFETGNLAYPAEFIGRSGRPRGLNCEIVVLLTDNHKSKLLEMPAHRYLFSLMNFTLPPVCPIQRIDYDPSDWKKMDTLSKVFHAFTHGLQEHPAYINGNYGLGLVSQYLPYDIDLYEQMMDARSLYHLEDKRSRFSSLFDSDKSAIVFNPKKFKDAEKFRKYAEHNFFGK